MDRFLKKALDVLNLKFHKDRRIKNISDVNLAISEAELQKENLINGIEGMEEQIEESKRVVLMCENRINSLNNIINQVEIEKFKDLNKGNKHIKSVHKI